MSSCSADGECVVPASTSASTTKTATASLSATTSNDTRPTVTVDITSDFNCPWCYVGVRRLEQAIERLDASRVRVDIRLHPFLLNPGLPEKAQDSEAYLRGRFGPRIDAMVQHLIQAAASSGIPMARFPPMSPSVRAHRLIAWLQQHHPDKAHAASVHIFKALWEDKQVVWDTDVLVACAQRAGIDTPEQVQQVRAFLESRELEREVRSLAEQAARGGISGVPNFVFNGKFEVSGAQEPETFLRELKKCGAAVVA